MRATSPPFRSRAWLGWGLIVLGLAIFVATFALPVDHRSQARQRAAVTLHGARFDVEVARTPEAWAHGLMGRPQLFPDTGMLFVYPEAKPRQFWMKDTRMPLDLLFFDSHGRLVDVRADTPPCRRDPCPTYASHAPAQYVLEIAGGTVQRMGVRSGDPLAIIAFSR